MVQVGYTTQFGLYDIRNLGLQIAIHNLGPTALGCVYPVETSTLLYNLYIISLLSSKFEVPVSNQ